MTDGQPTWDSCYMRGCDKTILLPLNPMVHAKVCEENGWKEVLVDGMYVILCSEHVGEE